MRLNKLVFDTADLEPKHRFDAASAYFEGLIEPRPVGDTPAPYKMRNVSWRIGAFVANRAENGPTANTMRDDHFMRDYCAIRYFDRGSYLSIADDSIHRIRPGSLTSTNQLDGVSTEGYAFYSLEAPRATIEAGLQANGRLRVPLVDSPAGRILLEMMSEVFEGLSDRAPTTSDVLVERVRALFELVAHGVGRAEEAARPAYLQARTGAMQRYIDAHLDDPELGPAQLASAFGLSRAGVFRALEPLGGVASAIARRRMVRAYRTLAKAQPRRGLVRAVAEACGYPDPAHFCRVFRRHLDLSPGDVAQFEPPAGAGAAPLEDGLAQAMPRLSETYR